jgi:hypothetical protein
MIWLALKARSSSQVSQLALAIEAPVVTSFRAGLDDIPRLGMVLAMPPLTEAVLAPTRPQPTKRGRPIASNNQHSHAEMSAFESI